MTANSASASALALVCCLASSILLFATRNAHAQFDPGTQAISVARIEFDIEAQRLGNALAAYSRATGLDVLIDGEHVQRTANGVRGALTAMEALETLLEGTGLEARYANSTSVVIRASRVPGSVVRPAAVASVEESGFNEGEVVHQSYAAHVQQALRSILCGSADTRPGAYRLALQLRLNARGTVEHFRLLSTTGEPARDAAVQRRVRGLAVGSPPPDSLPQPLVILLLPEGPGAESDCARSVYSEGARAP